MNIDDQKFLNKFIQDSFSISELKEICFSIGINYESLSHGKLGEFSIDLITHSNKNEKIIELLEVIYRYRKEKIDSNSSFSYFFSRLRSYPSDTTFRKPNDESIIQSYSFHKQRDSSKLFDAFLVIELIRIHQDILLMQKEDKPKELEEIISLLKKLEKYLTKSSISRKLLQDIVEEIDKQSIFALEILNKIYNSVEDNKVFEQFDLFHDQLDGLLRKTETALNNG